MDLLHDLDERRLRVARVEELAPNTHTRAPPGALSKIRFKNAQAGSKGFKRDPTPIDLEWLE